MKTPTLVTRAISRTEMMLTTVVMSSMMQPRSTAFAAPVGERGAESAPDPPTIWKPDQMAGSTAWTATAATATVRIWPMIMTQPVNQPTTEPASRDDHWKIAPEMGHQAAS